MSDSFAGQRGFTEANSQFNAIAFLVKMMLGNVATATIVQVKAVNAPTGLNPNYGTVDVLPLVNQIDSNGIATPHGTVFGLPYCRLQGGVNAVILDPVVGDIGIAIFASRDISAVKATKGQSNPGSRRRFDMADGIYLGGLLNGEPSCYIAFVDGGITMSPDAGVTSLTITPGRIRMVAAEINSHATQKNTWDADGNGFVYEPGSIHTYSDGISPSHSAPTPPEVPT